MTTIYQMYLNLEKCTESLEADVTRSLSELTKANNENAMALEASKDYHYKEILNHLKQIKEHIKIIACHDQSLQSIQTKITDDTSKQSQLNPSRIDKNYIKKQVETFQKFGVVNRRERKPIRPPETSSMGLLECWEKLLDQQELKGQPLVNKRERSLRKERKVVSSTIDTFLELSSDSKSVYFETVKATDVNSVNPISEELDKETGNRDAENNISLELPKETDVDRIEAISEEKNNDTANKSVSLELINCLEEISEEIVSTKPLIVDVIYKKDVSGQV